MAYRIQVADRNGIVLETGRINQMIILSHLNNDFASILNLTSNTSRPANCKEIANALNEIYDKRALLRSDLDDCGVSTSYASYYYHTEDSSQFLNIKEKKEFFLNCLRNNKGICLERMSSFNDYDADDAQPSEYALHQFGPIVSLNQYEDAKKIDKILEYLAFENEDLKQEFYDLFVAELIEDDYHNRNNMSHNFKTTEAMYIDKDILEIVKRVTKGCQIPVSRALNAVYQCQRNGLLEFVEGAAILLTAYSDYIGSYIHHATTTNNYGVQALGILGDIYSFDLIRGMQKLYDSNKLSITDLVCLANILHDVKHVELLYKENTLCGYAYTPEKQQGEVEVVLFKYNKNGYDFFLKMYLENKCWLF